MCACSLTGCLLIKQAAFLFLARSLHGSVLYACTCAYACMLLQLQLFSSSSSSCRSALPCPALLTRSWMESTVLYMIPCIGMSGRHGYFSLLSYYSPPPLSSTLLVDIPIPIRFSPVLGTEARLECEVTDAPLLPPLFPPSPPTRAHACMCR